MTGGGNTRPRKVRSAQRPCLVSIHGGHSGQFCRHAQDSLEEVVQAYVDKGFSWVGITEHMPPVDDRFLYPDEKEAGLRSRDLQELFGQYMSACRKLQEEHLSRMRIYVGFETETYTGSESIVRDLVDRFRPDYIVGSVHHVDDRAFDFSPEDYRNAAGELGGLDALYCRYFDQQYAMIRALRPAVVGHFDLVRIYDAEYRTRLAKKPVWDRVRRNLELVRNVGAILDVNTRALHKGADEPYVSRPILMLARDLNIDAVPGDDSHGVGTVGLHVQEGIRILKSLGFDTHWRRPVEGPRS